MIAEAHEQMHRILSQRQTCDLLDIWQANDRQKWSREAIQSVGEILRERQVELPPQTKALGEDADEPLQGQPVGGPAFEEAAVDPRIPAPDGALSPPIGEQHRSGLLSMVDSVLAPPPATVSPREYQAIDEKPDEVTDRWIPAEVYVKEDGSIAEIVPESQAEVPPQPPPIVALTWLEAWAHAYIHPSVNTFWRLANDPKASFWRAYLWVALASLAINGFKILVHLPEVLSLYSSDPSGPVPWVLGVTHALLRAALREMLILAFFAGIAYLVARLLRGKGSYVSHVYVFAAIYAPLVLITGLLSLLPANLIPYLLNFLRGGLGARLLDFYVLALFALAIRAVHGFGTGKASLAVLLSIVLTFFAYLGIVALLPALLP